MDSSTTSLVIIGATGDLAQHKLVPALFTLHCKGHLPDGLRIVGSARSKYSDSEFRKFMWQGTKEFVDLGARRDEWERFARNLYYVPGDLGKCEDFVCLKQRLEEFERHSPANRIFSLSITPNLFELAIKNLDASGLVHNITGWRRVLIEKPFGRDLASAQALNRLVHQVFDENEVFRIDHYLGKETVQNLLVFRFANAIFEPLWNRNYIDNVQITVAEQITVGDRAAYYDQFGVIRDMVQNHLFQLLTLIAMEPPRAADPESLRDKKVEVFRAIRRWSPEEAVKDTVRGQYRGYLQEKGVQPKSTTATYAALRLYIDNWRWEGVPFYLRTGKAMAEKVSEIVIEFKHPPHMVFSLGPSEDATSNILSFCLQPDEGVNLKFQVKVPGERVCTQPVNMEFNYESTFKGQGIPEAYERLLYDALIGDSSLFIRNDHIEEAWRAVDPLLKAWEDPKSLSPLYVYKHGSWGPAAADSLLAQDSRTWWQVCAAPGGGRA